MRSDLPTLNLLRAFEAAGSHLSFKLAADQLSVTPSAVSQQIHTLEEQLGFPLFVRGNRSLDLTDAGTSYWQKIHHHLNGIREATAELQRRQSGDIVKISILPPVLKRVVLPNLDDFYDRYPDIELHIESSSNFANLQTGLADLGIRFGFPPWEGLLHEKLSSLSVQLICPPGYTKRYNLDSGPANLLDMPLVQMTTRPDAWWKLWLSHKGLGSPTGKQVYVDDYPAAIEAAETLGAALAMYPIEIPLIESGRVEAPFEPIGPLDEAIYAVYPEPQKNNAGIRVFIEWLRAQLLAMGQ
jgi:LysR family glycine cleavage system transcriptional activator